MNKLLYVALALAIVGAVLGTASATPLSTGPGADWTGNVQYAVAEATSTGGSLQVTQSASASSSSASASQNAVIHADSASATVYAQSGGAEQASSDAVSPVTGSIVQTTTANCESNTADGNVQYAEAEATSSGGSLVASQTASANSCGASASQNAFVTGDSATATVYAQSGVTGVDTSDGTFQSPAENDATDTAGSNVRYAEAEAASTGGTLLVTQNANANTYSSSAIQSAIVSGDSGYTKIGSGGPNGNSEILSQFTGGSMISHGVSITTPTSSKSVEIKKSTAGSVLTTVTAADFISNLTKKVSSTNPTTLSIAFSKPGFVFVKTV